MTYEPALKKAWDRIKSLSPENEHSVRFFTEEYSVDAAGRKIVSRASGAAAKDFVSILLLHYLEKKLTGLPALTGEWISFRELESGESYYPAFRKRAIEPVLKKYGSNPQAILKPQVRKIDQADAAVELEAFEGVPIILELWKGDDEFGPEANILFDRSISGIFCTEDVAVLAGFVAKYV